MASRANPQSPMTAPQPHKPTAPMPTQTHSNADGQALQMVMKELSALRQELQELRAENTLLKQKLQMQHPPKPEAE